MATHPIPTSRKPSETETTATVVEALILVVFTRPTLQQRVWEDSALVLEKRRNRRFNIVGHFFLLKKDESPGSTNLSLCPSAVEAIMESGGRIAKTDRIARRVL